MRPRKNMEGGHALDVRLARNTLQTYPTHIAGLISYNNLAQQDLYDCTIRSSVRKLFRAALLIYPKRMAA